VAVHEIMGVVSAQRNAAEQSSAALEGVIVAGSYNAADSTVEVVIGDTYALPGFLDPSQPQATQQGDQYGPVGGERVLLFRTQSGWTAIIEHSDDDSPAVKSGERIIGHRNALGQIDASLHLTNDGPIPLDHLGGALLGGGGLAKVYTRDGIAIVARDDLNLVEITLPFGGPTLLLDGVAGTVSIGSAILTLDDGVIRLSDQDAAFAALVAAVNTALATLASRCAAGGGVVAPTVTAPTLTASTHVLAEG
jgi:hypothetical protein